MGVEWQTALGAVFISGIIFILLSVFKVREAIVRAIPLSLRYGVAAGIGIFLALIGLTSVGFIVGSPATTVTFGGMNVQTILFLVGMLITSVLLVKKVRGALVYGIIGTSIIALVVSLIYGPSTKKPLFEYQRRSSNCQVLRSSSSSTLLEH